jgi:hypothetical protein
MGLGYTAGMSRSRPTMACCGFSESAMPKWEYVYVDFNYDMETLGDWTRLHDPTLTIDTLRSPKDGWEIVSEGPNHIISMHMGKRGSGLPFNRILFMRQIGE